jgi:hypothetical protein
LKVQYGAAWDQLGKETNAPVLTQGPLRSVLSFRYIQYTDNTQYTQRIKDYALMNRNIVYRTMSDAISDTDFVLECEIVVNILRNKSKCRIEQRKVDCHVAASFYCSNCYT